MTAKPIDQVRELRREIAAERSQSAGSTLMALRSENPIHHLSRGPSVARTDDEARRPPDHLLEPEMLDASLESLTVDAVAIAHHVASGRRPWQCFNHLLSGPSRRRVRSHVDVKYSPPARLRTTTSLPAVVGLIHKGINRKLTIGLLKVPRGSGMPGGNPL